MKISIRFNTQAGESLYKWRVIIDGEEELATDVFINVISFTTHDLVSPEIGIKYNIGCEATSIRRTYGEGTKVISIY